MEQDVCLGHFVSKPKEISFLQSTGMLINGFPSFHKIVLPKHNTFFTDESPDNIVYKNATTIVIITSIFVGENNDPCVNGYVCKCLKPVYEKPVSSEQFSIFYISKSPKFLITFSLRNCFL